MTTYRFMRGTRLTWQETPYEIGIAHAGNIVTLRNMLTNEEQTVSIQDLTQALFANELTLIPSKQQDKPTAPKYIDLSSYSARQVEEARWRLTVIQPLLVSERGQRTRKYFDDYIARLPADSADNSVHQLEDGLSARTLYRWIKSYTESGYDIRSLIPNSGTRTDKDKPRIMQEADRIVRDVLHDLYLTRTKVSVNELLWEVARRIEEANAQLPAVERLKTPSRATVARRVQSLDVELKLTAKKGGRAAKRMMEQHGEMVEPTVLLERVEIDHTPLDIIVIDPQDKLVLGRPTFTFCIDVASRMPMGFSVSFDPPSYATVMDCLFHAVRPKDDLCQRYGTKHDWPLYGLPTTLVTDNGREFIGNDLADACQCLGITLEHMPPRTPQFKGTVERILGTINRTFIHSLPGTTFSNPKEKGDYDSAEVACVTLEDLTKTLYLFLVDVYSFSLHRGIGTTPYSKFQSLSKHGFAPRLPESAQELEVLLGRTTTRTIQHSGIEFEGLRYNSSVLAPLRQGAKGKTFKVKYNPHDLSRIHVLNEDTGEYLEVPALATEYTAGLSLWKHRVVQEHARAKYGDVDMVALGKSMHEIREVVAAGRAQKKMAGKRVARFDASKPSTTASEPLRTPEMPPAKTETNDPNKEADTTPAWLKAADEVQWDVDYTLPTTEENRRYGIRKANNHD